MFGAPGSWSKSANGAGRWHLVLLTPAPCGAEISPFAFFSVRTRVLSLLNIASAHVSLLLKRGVLGWGFGLRGCPAVGKGARSQGVGARVCFSGRTAVWSSQPRHSEVLSWEVSVCVRVRVRGEQPCDCARTRLCGHTDADTGTETVSLVPSHRAQLWPAESPGSHRVTQQRSG